MKQVQEFILSMVSRAELSKEKAKALLLELAAAPAQATVPERRDVAVIGMAGRFPQAADPEAFWQMLRKGVNAIREFPSARVDDCHMLNNPHFTEFATGRAIQPEDKASMHSKGGYMDEIDKFDFAFFGIPPMEALHMDPNHRLALEVAWEAMEDAGYGGDALKGSRTGVYIGKEGTNQSYYRQSSEDHPMQLTGTWESLMASRISHLMDFRSPCMVVDTACSAGAVSVHLAIQALMAGDCDVAIAGGINLSVNGELKADYQGGVNMAEVESSEGLVRTFDAKANGTVWGEGIGMVILKPLAQALRDGDHVQAVIKGSAINNDGASSSLTAPRAETQEAVILDAWQRAGIAPETITYIEAHGTGTVLGDPIEAKGLTNAFRRYTDRRQFCAIGSLKTSTGHMVGASGIAALIKIVKSLEHKELAPTLNFQTPNPYINFVDSPLYVNDALQPWQDGSGPRRAGLSSFGFSRTNCHMVVEEAPEQVTAAARQPVYCLTISARSETALAEYIRKYNAYLEQRPWTLADLCYTSNIGRGHYEYRAVIAAATEEELRLRVHALDEAGVRGGDALTGIQAGAYRMISEKKRQPEPGELTRHDREQLGRTAADHLRRYLDSGSTDTAMLEELCRLYASGADVDWSMLYQGERRRRLPAPVYPLQRTRCWSEPKIGKASSLQLAALHPLVERLAQSSDGRLCYETVFRTDRHWLLADHRIGGRAVLPGTGYLEMARFAAARELGSEALEFRDVFFLSPLVVEDGQEATVRLTLTSAGEGMTFAIGSRASGGSWTDHVEGFVKAAAGAPVVAERQAHAKARLASIQAQADTVIEPYVGVSQTEVFSFGPHWDAVRTVWQSGADTLARLRLPEHLAHEHAVLRLHPSVLDNAVNLTSQIDGATYLPFMYRQLLLHAPLGREIYSHIRVRQEKGGSGETITYDIDLLDAEGALLAEIRDYTVKRVHQMELLDGGIGTEPSCLQMAWTLRGGSSAEPAAAAGGRWALIATDSVRCRQLAAALEDGDAEVTVYRLAPEGAASREEGTYSPDDAGIAAILDDVSERTVGGILFAADYTMTDGEPRRWLHDHAAFRAARSVGVDALFRLCRQLLRRKLKDIVSLKVLVRDGWVADGSETDIMPLSAATVSLARVISQEYVHLSVDMLDVSGDVAGDEIVREWFVGTGLRCLRPTGVYVEELRPFRMPIDARLELRTDGVYVITGGLGGLGLEVAERLASKGQAHVVLLGRSELEPAERWEAMAAQEAGEQAEEHTVKKYGRLLALKSRLASLDYRSIDVSDADAVAALGLALKQSYGAIAGIFHAAGVAGDGFIMLKSEAHYHTVLNPKLDGALNLLRLLAEDGESAGGGFLSLFSSIAALTGGEGQGDYSAGNAFLDGLAEMARMSGLNASAVNWPTWEAAGMAFQTRVEQEAVLAQGVEADVRSAITALAFLDSSLFDTIEVREGMDWLERSIAKPGRRIVPAALNQELAVRLGVALPFRVEPRLLEGARDKSEAAAGRQTEERRELEVVLRGVLEPTPTQQELAGAFGRLLGLQEIDMYASFQDMGGNSLMTTQLLRLIDGRYPGLVDISDLFSYPSVHELADYIERRTREAEGSGDVDGASGARRDEELADLIEQELGGTEFLESFMEQLQGREQGDS